MSEIPKVNGDVQATITIIEQAFSGADRRSAIQAIDARYQAAIDAPDAQERIAGGITWADLAKTTRDAEIYSLMVSEFRAGTL